MLPVVTQGAGNPQEGRGRLGRLDAHFETREHWAAGGEALVAGGEGPGMAGLEALPHHRWDDLSSLGIGQAWRTMRKPGEALHSHQGQAHCLGCQAGHFGRSTVCQRSVKKCEKITY